MGGFAGLLGHAAGGFEQAHQEDLSRQFADLQARRSAAGELLTGLASDPNQSDELRQLALQARMQMLQEKPNKDFNFGKTFEPIFNHIAQVTARQKAAASAPPQQTTTQVPAMQLGQTALPATNATVLGPPPAPPPGVLASIPQIAQNTATVAGAQAGGQLAGQIGARQKFLNQIPELPPEMKAALGLGTSLYPMMRQVGTGAGYAKDLRAQGLEVPASIADDQWVNVKELGSGQHTFIPAAAPGEKALKPGELGTASEVAGQSETARQAAKLPFDLKKIGVRFGNSLALQQNAFQLAVNRNAMDQANAIFSKGQEDYLKRRGALQLMEDNYADALKGNQQAMVSMLFNHMGMTSGAVPGTRMTRAAVDEAQESANRIGLNVAKWFHQDTDGNYVFDGPKGGVNLTKTQMDQMIELAKQRVNTQHAVVESMQNELAGQGEFQAPGVRAVRGGQGKPKKGGGPPKPPAAKTLTRAAIAQAAKDHNVSEAEAERQAKAAGYTIQ